MAWTDLRELLEHLRGCGELVAVTRPVDPVHELAAYIRRSSDTAGPAFLFSSVTGHEGWTVLGGLYSYRRVAIMLGCEPSGVVERYAAAVAGGMAPVRVDGGPVHEVVLRGEEADLTRLPAPVHSADDAGRYITGGVVLALDPDTGVRACGIQRFQVQGPRRLGMSAPAERRIARAFYKAEERGEPLPVAIAIGSGCYVDLASQAKVPHRVDKLAVAGGLAGRPVEVCPAVTSAVEVPARAELVVEGRVLPGLRATEGPFGEVGGTYGEAGERPVVEVDAITMRRDAIFQTVLTGMPTTENHVMGWPAVCESVRRCAEQGCPEVVDVHAVGPYYVAIVSIRKRLEGEPRNVILSVLGPTAGAPQAKYCIVVDDDIDVRNWDEVLWALYTRAQPDRDFLILPPMVGSPLDPSAPRWRHSSKVGIDATCPLGADRARFRRAVVPGADRVRW